MKYSHDNNNTEYVIELYKDGSRADYLENNKVEAIQKLDFTDWWKKQKAILIR